MFCVFREQIKFYASYRSFNEQSKWQHNDDDDDTVETKQLTVYSLSSDNNQRVLAFL